MITFLCEIFNIFILFSIVEFFAGSDLHNFSVDILYQLEILPFFFYTLLYFISYIAYTLSTTVRHGWFNMSHLFRVLIYLKNRRRTFLDIFGENAIVLSWDSFHRVLIFQHLTSAWYVHLSFSLTSIFKWRPYFCLQCELLNMRCGWLPCSKVIIFDIRLFPTHWIFIIRLEGIA